jgi:hypothetical protein
MFTDNFLFVIGGDTADGVTDVVELISLNPCKNPVPARLTKLKRFPRKIHSGGGALLDVLDPGNFLYFW